MAKFKNKWGNKGKIVGLGLADRALALRSKGLSYKKIAKTLNMECDEDAKINPWNVRTFIKNIEKKRGKHLEVQEKLREKAMEIAINFEKELLWANKAIKEEIELLRRVRGPDRDSRAIFSGLKALTKELHSAAKILYKILPRDNPEEEVSEITVMLAETKDDLPRFAKMLQVGKKYVKRKKEEREEEEEEDFEEEEEISLA